MFCGDGLAPREDADPFMQHIESRAECHDAFDAWVHHMQTDWIGD